MEATRTLRGRIRRWAYPLGMYTGLRAWSNRRRARGCALDARLLELHGRRARDERLGEVLVFVDPRPGAARGAGSTRHGMISLRQVAPPVGRLLYRYLVATSHFGRAHVEVAFHEAEGLVTFYGVRNIARANALRLGLPRLASRLGSDGTEEVACVLLLLARLAREVGLATALAPARECVALSVDEALLRPDRSRRFKRDLQRRYARLATTCRELTSRSIKARPGPG